MGKQFWPAPRPELDGGKGIAKILPVYPFRKTSDFSGPLRNMRFCPLNRTSHKPI